MKRDCASEPLAGEAGVVTRAVTAQSRSVVTATLRGSNRSDWDLAVFNTKGEPVAVSSAYGSDERAATPVGAGEQLTVQACRLDGAARHAALSVALDPLPTDRAPVRASLESVDISGPADAARLARLGIDVTHEVSADHAIVVLHSAAERALLSSADYEATPLIEDLAAADAAQLRAEAHAAPGSRSALPSGRDSYRQYADYTTELKALADANPALVREVTVGSTLEGRPIQGVEIAQDVLRADDGRPVYLNLGVHHAREWPSAEMPMEFARDLVSGFNAGANRVQQLLAGVRVVIVPVVNVDGFIASRSFGFNSLTDDDPFFYPGQVGAYRRKNCRPRDGVEAAVPCAQRLSSSGVDLNRNYGYYWGGSGSSTTATFEDYRGTSPFSEPESEAVHQFSSGIHPTVVISNHTFTADGKWLRQPGFDDVIAVTEDEIATKSLGDSMAAATGWTSELGYATLGDITGATEDWNYFAQGAYGYTPEVRGPNFHGTYANMVVAEYLGDAGHPGQGVREAFLLAGEIAASESHHGVVEGSAPPGATLSLRKTFASPTSQAGVTVPEELDTTSRVGASGAYQWHVNPSSRPDVDSGPGRTPAAETWSMTCVRPGDPTVHGPVAVSVGRGQQVTRDWLAGDACGADPTPVNQVPDAAFTFSPTAPLAGQQVSFISTSTDPDGAIATTEWDLDDDGAFDDASGLAASRTFPSAGSFRVAVRVSDDGGEIDIETRTVAVSAAPPPTRPPASQLSPPQSTPAQTGGRVRCRGVAAGVVGTRGRDVFVGTAGNDVSAALGGNDRVRALGGDDIVCGGPGRDRLSGGPGRDKLSGGPKADRLFGGPGADRLGGGNGRDRLNGGAGNDNCRGGRGRDAIRRCP
ncbi:hypothetical protein BH20ACT15_BH20ACT15_01810 [soil metagenome]